MATGNRSHQGDDDSDGELHHLEGILDERIVNGKVEYLLSWKIHTWFPAEHMQYPELVAEFKRNRKGKEEPAEGIIGEQVDLEKKTVQLQRQEDHSNSSRVKEEEKKSKAPVKRKLWDDSDAPQSPASAFALFCRDERPKLIQQRPEYTYHQITRELGEMWQGSDPRTMRRYLAMSETDMRRYNKELAEYKKKQKRDSVGAEEEGQIEWTDTGSEDEDN